MMGKVEEMERVIRMSPKSPFLGGMPAAGGGEQGCETLRGMGSGILLVMYYTPRALGKGVGGSAWVCANIVTVPKRWVLGTTPLTGRSVGKSKPGCSVLLRQQRQRHDVPAEASATCTNEMYSE